MEPKTTATKTAAKKATPTEKVAKKATPTEKVAKKATPTKKVAKKATPSSQADPSTSSSPRRQLMENEVLEHATRLFAEKGFAGTNLQDVAASMGLKRPALYYYFKNKDELLERLIFEATAGPANDLQTVASQTEYDAGRRLHELARRMVVWVASHSDRFLLLVKSESDLSPASAKAFTDGRRAALNAVRGVIEEGVESGQFRPMDPLVASFGVWGICNWVAFWYQPDGTQSIDAIADQLADMALASLQRAEERGNTALSLSTTLAVLRQDLDRLEQALSGDRSMESTKPRFTDLNPNSSG